MHVQELGEWAILQAAQARLLLAVDTALRIVSQNQGAQNAQDAQDAQDARWKVDEWKLIKYELRKMAISIPPEDELNGHVLQPRFSVAARKVFIPLERILKACPKQDTSAADQEFPRLCNLCRQHQLQEGYPNKSDVGTQVISPSEAPGAWSSVLLSLTDFNMSMEKMFWGRGFSDPKSEFDSRSLDCDIETCYKAKVTDWLEVLRVHLSRCDTMLPEKDAMLLQLAGQKWKPKNDIPVSLSLFLTCGCIPSWRMAECRHLASASQAPSADSRSPNLELVEDLCQWIIDCDEYNDVLRLLLNEERLYRENPEQNRMHTCDNMPVKSIKDLLVSDNLVPSSCTSHATYTLQEKRELSLHLAWSFVYLFDVFYTDDAWSSEKILLTASTVQQSPVVDISKAPYILCAPEQKNIQENAREPSTLGPESVFLSFAKLLVEIDTGKTIEIRQRTKPGHANLWLTIAEAIENGEMYAAGDDYIKAVEGCLSLHRSVKRPKRGGGITYATVFNQIVAYLEEDFARYRKPNLTQTRNYHSKLTVSKWFGRNESQLDIQASEVGLYARHLENNFRITRAAKRRLRANSHDMYPSGISDVGGHREKSPKLFSVDYVRGNPIEPPTKKSASRRPRSRDEFTIAIICALRVEYSAIEVIVDEFWDEHGDDYGKVDGDPNNYTTCRIGKHDVVLILLPRMGKVSASSAANSIRLSYRSIRLALLVGICGAVPVVGQDQIFLGDVIVSNSVVEHDFGREYGDRFRRKDTAFDKHGGANKEISSLVEKFQTPRTRNLLLERTASIMAHLHLAASKTSRANEHHYRNPGPQSDKLFPPSYRHKHQSSSDCGCTSSQGDSVFVCNLALGATCSELGCDDHVLLDRNRDANLRGPNIHIGSVASGDKVIKSGAIRDRMARDLDVIAFEMEGAGAWDELPCLLIKGVADYADSHKNKDWQPFAAAAAASATKAILERFTRTDKVSTPAI